MKNFTNRHPNFFTFATIAFLLVALTTCVLVLLWNAGIIFQPTNDRPAEVYPMMTKVIAFDEAEDLVICEDFNGFVWAFEGIEDWNIGDCANLLMNDMGTAKIFDDEIVSVRYDAWSLER